MDVYLLDPNFNQIAVVDTFDSIVWTERYNTYGDVTLVVAASDANRDLFVENMFLKVTASQEVMLVESVSEENGTITVTGMSLVGFLANRMFRDTWTTATNGRQYNDTAGNVALSIVNEMCVKATGLIIGVLPSTLGANELITGLTVALSAPTGPTLNLQVPYGNVYDAVKSVCDLDTLGFAIYQDADGTPNFTFTVYRGQDRTSSQSTYPAVIFDSAIETLTNIKQLRSVAGYKTHAYAVAPGQHDQINMGIAIAPGASNVSGWQRRTMFLVADDINPDDYFSDSQLKEPLDQRAKDALANNNYVRMTDGQLVPQSAFTYDIDYSLGDIIELRGSNSTSQSARIIEYIRAQDSTGERAYPTLSVIDG